MEQYIQFVKMHGLGNDFLLVNAIDQAFPESRAVPLAKKWCDRHFGIGADGIILVHPSNTADFRMQVINSDGSEPEMCGNGIRCFAKFVVDHKLSTQKKLTIETLAGPMTTNIIESNNQITMVKVDMGEPILNRHDIPVSGKDNNQVINDSITVDGSSFNYTAVSMGNPHSVVFVDDLEAVEFERLGPQFEGHPNFPERINTEFVEILSLNECKIKVWERGAGPTLACGTGACAVVVAGVLNGKLARRATVNLPGGPLQIDWQEPSNHVMMTGPAETVFSGTVKI